MVVGVGCVVEILDKTKIPRKCLGNILKVDFVLFRCLI